MSNYLLFVKDARHTNQKILDDVGLSVLCRDAGPEMVVTPSGPDGSTGVIACWRSGKTADDLTPEFRESQTWMPMAANPEIGREAGKVWIGWDPNRKPTPSTLVRKRPFPGTFVPMLDGHRWLVPEAFKLPREFGLDQQTGDWVPVISAEFRSFCERAEDLARQFAEVLGKLETLKENHPEMEPRDIKIETSVTDGLDLAVEALSLNYRLTKEIIASLGLFDQSTVTRTLCALVSWHEILEVQDKKKVFPDLMVPATSRLENGFWTAEEA